MERRFISSFEANVKAASVMMERTCKIAIAVDMGDCIVLKHGPSLDVHMWAERERERLMKDGRVSQADNLVVVTLPVSMSASEATKIVQNPREFFRR